MHELALAESIVDIVVKEATRLEARQVSSVRLQIGDAMSVVSDSLLFSFELLAAQEPVLAGAQLLVETLPHLALCRQCQQNFPVLNFITRCPVCQSWETEVISGTELRILEMEIV